jgi:hypothetical protein
MTVAVAACGRTRDRAPLESPSGSTDGGFLNFLEQLVVEFYEFQGFFVRRNVMVGRRTLGGYDCELDVVAFHPKKKKLVHIEPSMDANSWEKREQRYAKKFEAGRKHIPALFEGLDLPAEVDQIALFGFGGKGPNKVGGGRVMLVSELMQEIAVALKGRSIAKAAVPEGFPLLRAVLFTIAYVVPQSGS